MSGISLKINVRHSTTGPTIRTVSQFTNFTFNQKFNSFASTFSFDFYFDPKNLDHAELICVSHMHECYIYYNDVLVLTGYILAQKFTDPGKAELVTISGYSKPGVLCDCDIPLNLYPLETDGLTLRQIINRIIPPFHIGIQIDKKTKGLDKQFVAEDKDVEEKTDEDLGKTASDSAQNAASYLSQLANQRNIIISHTRDGKLWITTPNTKGKPIFNFDFTSDDPNNDARKIPGLKVDLEFNGQGLHTEITAIQQADDEEESNAPQSSPLRNPLIPIRQSTIYRPKVVVINSGDQFTVNEAAKFELGKEIRDNVTLKVDMAKVDFNNELIFSNNTITVINPSVSLYKKSTWFIQSVDINITPKAETCTLNCVLPFAYDFDLNTLKNVFVEPGENLPRLK